MLIDDHALANLAKLPKLVAEFPFLKEAQKLNASGCSCSRPAVDTNAIKARIAELADVGRQRFLKLANTSKIKVVYRDGNTVVQTVDFAATE